MVGFVFNHLRLLLPPPLAIPGPHCGAHYGEWNVGRRGLRLLNQSDGPCAHKIPGQFIAKQLWLCYLIAFHLIYPFHVAFVM